jgi:hypothetical protein
VVSLTKQLENSDNHKTIPVLLDPKLLKSARQIYHTYCRFHSKLNKTPIGVAIHRKTYRGQLLFTKTPILLPWENFITIDQIESEIH